MAINIEETKLIPVRRDGQISSFNVLISGGGGAAAGSTATYVSYELTDEINARITGDTYNYSLITGETAARIAADAELEASIDSILDNKNSFTGNTFHYLTNTDTGINIFLNSTQGTRINSNEIGIPNNATFLINTFTGGTGNVNIGRSGTGTVTINNILTVTGQANFYEDLQSESYTPGYAGNGWKLDESSSEYNLEVDNLRVRNKLSAYELEINELNTVGGGLVISPANGTAYSISGTTRIIFDTNGGADPIQFQIDDVIKAQIWTGAGIDSYLGRVINVHQSSTLGQAYIDVINIDGTPYDGAHLVQFGNTGATDRQSLIYLTSMEDNSPWIALYTGLTSGSTTGKEVVRIGNLSGVTDSNWGDLTGYGLYADNVYLRGHLMATSGEFASTAQDYDGKVSSIKLSGADIWEDNYNGDASILYINRIGYNGTQNYYRNTAICDGKGNTIYVFNKEWCNAWVYTTFHNGVYFGAPTDTGHTMYPYSILTSDPVGFGDQARFDTGTGATPSISFLEDTNSGFFLVANDNIGVSVGGTEKFRFASNGDFHADGDVIGYSTTVSDKRLKKDIEPLKDSISKIKKLEGIKYKDRKTEETHFGFIAQDVENIIPEVVTEQNILGDDEKYKMIRYQELIPYLVEAIKSQQKQIEQLERDLNYWRNYNM